MPCTWLPETVTNPTDNQPFTEAGAWEFIACLLDDIDDVEMVRLMNLDHPPGQLAFVMTCPVPGGVLYIKVHDGAGQTIVGRSFHYSERGN